MPYEVVIFDLDFTLFDSELSERQALSATFAKFNINVTDEILRIYRDFNSQLWMDFEKKKIELADLRTERFQRLCEEFDFDLNASGLADIYEKNLGNYGGLYDGAEELLKTAKNESKVALITNGLESVQKARLSNYELEKFFDAILISGECGLSKPDSLIFQQCLDLLGHKDRSSVIMIGDSLSSDIRGANNFGIDSCWFNPHGQDMDPTCYPTFTAESLADITFLL
jgi:putative hydrolase of the HAD superfamily